MHLTSEDTAAINIAIGAGLTLAATTLTQWRTRRETRANRRRDAYAAFLLACDHLERTWSNPETLEAEHVSQRMGEVTGGAVREIQRAYAVVLLTGSKKARSKADAARRAAWDLNNRLHDNGAQLSQLQSNLGALVEGFSDTAAKFTELAVAETS